MTQERKPDAVLYVDAPGTFIDAVVRDLEPAHRLTEIAAAAWSRSGVPSQATHYVETPDWIAFFTHNIPPAPEVLTPLPVPMGPELVARLGFEWAMRPRTPRSDERHPFKGGEIDYKPAVRVRCGGLVHVRNLPDDVRPGNVPDPIVVFSRAVVVFGK